MSDLRDPKPALRHYLQQTREALVWKLDGLGEREVRLPRTPTGTTLLGIVRHCANVEIGYFGPTFGRPWPDQDHPCYVTDAEGEADPQADWRVPADVSTGELVDFYRSVWAFADETIEALPLEAEGRVPWWSGDSARVTLQQVVVHVIVDLSRRAGHADVVREGLDGAVGLRADVSNMPDGTDWSSYVAELTRVAESFPLA